MEPEWAEDEARQMVEEAVESAGERERSEEERAGAAGAGTAGAETAGLPREPAPGKSTGAEGASGAEPGAEGAGAAQAAPEAAEALKALVQFHLFGRRPPGGDAAEGDYPVPALLHPYRDLTRVRHDYPVCLATGDDGPAARPIAGIVDDLLSGLAGDDDDGRRLELNVRRLEAALRRSADEGPGEYLGRLWDGAAEELLSSSRLSSEKKETLKSDLDAARRALDVEGEVVTCDPKVPERLLHAVVNRSWKRRCGAWSEELSGLAAGLENILRADFGRSGEARSPEQLAASVGSDTAGEMDFERMSAILGESHLGEPLPEERRGRIEETLGVLRQMAPLYDGTARFGSEKSELPFPMNTVTNDGTAAVELHRVRMRAMVEFFRSVRVARLEIENGYRDDVHDPYFEAFDESSLVEEELELFPPVLLVLDGTYFRKKTRGLESLLSVLASGVPIKILALLDGLIGAGEGPSDPARALGWPARLASMALAMNHAFVLQATVSRPELMESGFRDGLGHAGPALFSIYTGSRRRRAHLAPFHEAAAALDSRVFPAFVHDPQRGPTWADRMSIAENPQSERDFPVEPFTYLAADDEETTAEVAFTPAEFLYCDTRFEENFWTVPPELWHPDMAPIGEVLGDGRRDATRIPYFVTVDEEGRVGRVVVTRTVLDWVDGCRERWRSLQEQGGVNNSHALRLLEEERGRLEEEKKNEVEAIEKKYVAELDRDLSELTREIVQRIAAQILAQGEGGAMAAPFPAAPARAAAPAAAPEAPAAPEAAEKVEEEEEEEAVTFDEPYIDTPLCTTCNECTNLNSQLFAYNANKQAVIKDPSAGTFRELVTAAERCPVRIIHPGKPQDPSEPGLDELVQRAEQFN
jgi:ferredoxin